MKDSGELSYRRDCLARGWHGSEAWAMGEWEERSAFRSKESKILQVCVRENQGSTGWASLIWSAWDDRCFTQWSFLILKLLHTHTSRGILEMRQKAKPGIHSCFIHTLYNVDWKLFVQCFLCTCVFDHLLSHECGVSHLQYHVDAWEVFESGVLWTFGLGVINLPPPDTQGWIRRTFRVSDNYQCWWNISRIVLELCRPFRNVAYTKVVYITAIWHVGHQNCCLEHLIPN